MKRNIMILILICVFTNNICANIDSLIYFSCDSNYSTEIIDSNLLQEEKVINLESKSIKVSKRESEIELNKKENLIKPMNWFSDAWDFFIDLFKPVHGLYKEDGYRNEGPYFLFDRIYDGGATYTRIQMQRSNKTLKTKPTNK